MLKNKKIRAVITAASAVGATLLNSACVLATSPGDLGLESGSDKTIAKKAVSKFIGPFQTFGYVAIVFAIMAVIFSLIYANKRPEQRSEVMGRLPWIAGISAGIGSISLLAGWVIGLGA